LSQQEYGGVGAHGDSYQLLELAFLQYGCVSSPEMKYKVITT